MPRDPAGDELIRKYGRGPGARTAGQDTGGKAVTMSAAPSEGGGGFREAMGLPQPGDRSYQDLSWQEAGGQGVAKGLAGTAVGIGRLASDVLPEGVSNYVSGLGPMKKLTEFADAPYEGPAEMFGSGLTQGALALLGPEELKLAGMARQAARNYMGRQGLAITPGARQAERIAGMVGGGAEMAGRGAAEGAIADSKDPVHGAAAGAAGGLAGPLVGGALRSPLGRLAGEVAGAELPFEIFRHATGTGFWPLAGPLLIWHRSPIGKKLRWFGKTLVDEAGRIIGEYRPGMGRLRQNPISGGPRMTGKDRVLRPGPRETIQPHGRVSQGLGYGAGAAAEEFAPAESE